MSTKLLTLINNSAHRLSNYDPIIAAIDDKVQVVMIGEETHGTHDFYQHRANITKRLIQEKGFTIVAVEADFPDAYRVNRYVQSKNSTDTSAREALGDFKRFPRWMWRNTVVVDFIEWLKEHNRHAQGMKTGFYGLDVYSLQTSREEVIKFLEKYDPELARVAKKKYGCFDRFSNDMSAYGYVTGLGLGKSCEKEAISVQKAFLERVNKYIQEQGIEEDKVFYAKQNAIIVANAEEYYRKMFEGGVTTWNIRDTHMVDTLIRLMERYKTPQKAVIWAHNSHLGDAQYTDMGRGGEINIGQLVREHFGIDHTFNIGFTTYNGSVTAAYEWDEPPTFMKVNNAMSGSYAKLFHNMLVQHRKEFEKGEFALIFRTPNKKLQASQELIRELLEERLERAIGVIYRADTEYQSHYFYACLPRQFDCVIHVNTSYALEPLDIEDQWARGAKEFVPDTFPFGV